MVSLALSDGVFEPHPTAERQRFRRGKSKIEGYRFLVVEDDLLIAMEAVERLSLLGMEVLGPATTVADAVQMIEHGPAIDCALLDFNLNGEMSYPAAGLLRMKQIPFAFVSGYDDCVLPGFFRDALVCSKPADWETIAMLVAHSRRRANLTLDRVSASSAPS
ncbi:hypothetical protein ASE04_19050 [Rhizobium sp. Root708]|uniref:response regulator n=1 Tax=Rhizobium sp. Root708 TaxID=1736592 RepID=UPI0006FD1884|nr:response regulator [Rhizobium sp. Root708]KRB49267.1 hypothetical protein ASE04_19050 [Rhizobium sp. Root708]